MGCSNDNIIDEPIKLNIINKEKQFDFHENNKFNGLALKLHNDFRRMHGVDNLKLNQSLCQKASNKVLKLLNSKEDLKYEKDDDDNDNDSIDDIEYGENLCISYGKLFDIENVINTWYNEEKNYNYDSNKYKKGTGHFTQMIWKGTKEVGFGYSKLYNNKSIFLVYYYPAGNEIGKFKENVLKKKNDL